MSNGQVQSITSRSNGRVLDAIQLRNKRSRREEAGLLFAEGLRLCEAAWTSGTEISELFFSKKAAEKYETRLEQIAARAEKSYLISDHVADYMTDTKNPQGIFALCKLPAPVTDFAHTGRRLVLEGISDPGNLGTLLRTAEAFGFEELILCGCADEYGPKALRAGMGAQLRQRLMRTDDLPALLEKAKQQGILSFAAVPDSSATPVTEAVWGEATLVVLGNEANGVSDMTLRACSGRVTIPMRGRAESLNAAAAGAIICWELSKDRK
jgi:TrmH family RNA methyltransferase